MSVTPYLVVRGGARAIDFYTSAFGAEEIFRMTDPSDGRVGHAELSVSGSTVMLADEYPDFGAVSPDALGGSPITLHMATQTVDADVARAIQAGATLLRPPTDQSFGVRTALLLDPFGHRWMLGQTIENLSPAEMQARWDEETSA